MTVGFLGGKFLPFHLGHLYAILEASSQVDKLYVVLSSSPNRDKELCERDGIKYMPAEVRMSWLGQSFNSIENIEIINIIDDSWDADYDWEEGSNLIKEAIPEPIDVVFSSEVEYEKYFSLYYPTSKHIIIDNARDVVPISATELRRDLYNYWEMLPASVKGFFAKKVCLVGTESCGKSTLTEKLAKFYNTSSVHEVGRDYCEKYGNNLTSSMFDSIAMEHYILQEKTIENCNKILFIDSDAVITQYYLNMYRKGYSSLIEEIIKKQEYDLILYLEPDVKWVDDGIRFAGDEEIRNTNNILLKRLYQDKGFSIISIHGDYAKRFNDARRLVSELF